MDIIELILTGFSNICNNYWLEIVVGVLTGLVFTAVPGMSIHTLIVVLLPATMFMEPIAALIFIASVQAASCYATAIAPILANIPGQASAVMTVLDGYPLATVKKKPGEALLIAHLSSFFGGIIGAVVLVIILTAIPDLGAKITAIDLLVILILALGLTAFISGDSTVKSLCSIVFGIAVAIAGKDPLSIFIRSHYGVAFLNKGIPLLSVMIGLFGFVQVRKLWRSRDQKRVDDFSLPQRNKIFWYPTMITLEEFRRLFWPAVRGSFIGCFGGICPGLGATTSAALSYSTQACFKNKEPLGSGSIEGLAASESANNAASACNYFSLFALGLPGGTVSAIIMAAMIQWQIGPSPRFMSEHSDVAWSFIAGLFMMNIFAFILSVISNQLFLRIMLIPPKFFLTIVLAVCFISSYCVTNSLFAVGAMLIAAAGSYFLQKYKFPLPPLVLAMFLTNPILKAGQEVLRQQEGFAAIWASPFAICLFIAFVFFVIAKRR